MSEQTFSIQGTSTNSTKFVSKARHFLLTIDEPPELGGTDQGANPVELLLSAYAGCLNVVGHLVAKEIGFKLEKIDIEISGNINPKRLLGKSFDERSGFQNIEVTLKPKGHATPGQLYEWLKKVGNRCPINDNLKNSTSVKVSVSKSLTPRELN